MSTVVIFATLTLAGFGFRRLMSDFLSYRVWCGRLTALTAEQA